MDEYANKFLELLRYVQYIRDEKVKIQRFLSGLPQSYKDRIKFYEPRTLEEAIRKAKYCYEQIKGKPDYHKAWKDKKNENSHQRKKGFKPFNFRTQQKQPLQAVDQPAKVMGGKPRNPKENREPLQCWRCGGPHLCRNFLLENGNVRPTYNIQEAETMDQVARTIPRIYAELEDLQADHQSTVVEVAGNIAVKSISVLIGLGSTHSYIPPRVVEVCSFKKLKHSKSWLVQLATRTKRKASEMVK